MAEGNVFGYGLAVRLSSDLGRPCRASGISFCDFPGLR